MTVHDPPPPQMQTFEFCPTQGRMTNLCSESVGVEQNFLFSYLSVPSTKDPPLCLQPVSV